jgi:hypothetical protein
MSTYVDDGVSESVSVWKWSRSGGQYYIWLGLHGLAHGAEDLDLASGEVGSVGSVGHAGGMTVDVWGSGVVLVYCQDIGIGVVSGCWCVALERRG